MDIAELLLLDAVVGTLYGQGHVYRTIDAGLAEGASNLAETTLLRRVQGFGDGARKRLALLHRLRRPFGFQAERGTR